MSIPVTKDIDYACKIISQGRLVAFPTATSYGLAADTQQGFALQRLRNIKRRPADKAFTVAMKSQLWNEYITVSDLERQIIEKLQGQSITVLVKPKEYLAHLSQDGLVGLRLIDHPIMKSFVEALTVPITATSANVSGEEPCLNPQEIIRSFPSKIDETTYELSLGAILDGGILSTSLPSTIIRLNQENSTVSIVRTGAVATSQISFLLSSYGFTVGA